MDSQCLLNCGSISLKTVLIFCKNFLTFRSDIIEKQGIINLSSKRSVDLSDFEVVSLWGTGECRLSSIFLLNFVYTQHCIIKKKWYMIVFLLNTQNYKVRIKNFLVLHTSGGILVRPATFLLLIFFCHQIIHL